MARINQLIRQGNRKKKKRSTKYRALEGSPMRRGLCVKVYIVSPKKPNSAYRKVAKVRLSGSTTTLIAAIPGEGHNLMAFSTVLVRAGRIPDLPGVKYKIIRGKYDFLKPEDRRANRRSKFGVKRRPFLAAVKPRRLPVHKHI